MRKCDDIFLALLYGILTYKIAYPLWLFLGAGYLRSVELCSDVLSHLPRLLLTPAATGSIGLLCALVFAPRSALFKSTLILLFTLSLLPTLFDITTVFRDLQPITPPGLRIKRDAYEYLSVLKFYLHSLFPLILFGVLVGTLRRRKNSYD